MNLNIDKYLDSGLASVVKDQLTRKLINSIYMPQVYGKTRHSAREDILKALHFALSQGEAYKVADALYRFWEERYPGIDNLMTLVNEVGWFSGFFNKPFWYQSEYITTIQDSIKL